MRAYRLGSILDDWQAVIGRDRHDGLYLARIAGHVHGDDSGDALAFPRHHPTMPADAGSTVAAHSFLPKKNAEPMMVYPEIINPHVSKDRFRAAVGDSRRRGRERQRRHNNRVARLDSYDRQCGMECGCPAGRGTWRHPRP